MRQSARVLRAPSLPLAVLVALLVAVATSPPNALAQTYYDLSRYVNDPPGKLAATVSIAAGTSPVERLLRDIGRQANLSIVFDTDAVAALPARTFSSQTLPAASALVLVLRGTGLKAMVSSDWRVIVSSDEAPSEPHVARTQTIRGVVTDRYSGAPLYGATIVLLNSDPLIGTTTDADGRYELLRVPVGRHDIEARFLGFESVRRSGVLVGSAKEAIVDFELVERVLRGEEVVISPAFQKDRPINELAAVSVRAFTVEETRRYAGGVDDPARIASAFAGVTTTGDIGDNALIIRGNAPKGVLWRLEGVEIPNPNHFAGLNVAGGGGVTIFSSQMLDDSDFLTGAFPAEYGNALAGVFDMHLRRGSTSRREHTFQIGLLGIDAASEGPFRKGSNSSYLFNYRYSTLGLLMPLLPVNDVTKYQDLSFKASIATSKAGRLDFWGIGGLDGQRQHEVEDSTDWQYLNDRTRMRLSLGMGAAGLTYRHILDEHTYVSASVAATAQNTTFRQWYLQSSGALVPELRIRNTSGRVISSVTLNHRFAPGLLNRTGVVAQQLLYDLDVAAAPSEGSGLTSAALGRGSSTLFQGFTHQRFTVGNALTMDAGLHFQYFALSTEISIEPRGSIRADLAEGQAINAGYGLHSQIEDLRIYFADTGESDRFPNTSLGMTKAHHFVLGYDVKLGDVSRLRAEGYYQYLFNVPVIADSTYSLLNFEQDFEFRNALVNEGAGRNYGVELTVERFLKDGYYFLVTGSVFKATFRGGDDVWRNSRFDRVFATNALFGREFLIRRSGSVLGVNGRLTYNGGHRYSPVDQTASADIREVVFDESRVFTERAPAQAVVDLTITYARNKRRYASAWALQIKNVFGAGLLYHDFDYTTGRVEALNDAIVLPVLSYKVEF